MSNPILERIERAEKKLPDIRAQRKVLEADAKKNDGRLTEDDPEFKRIEKLDIQIAELERIVRDQRKIFEDNKAKWNALGSECTAVLAQINEVITWGDPEARDAKTVYEKAHNLARDDCYSDAIETFKDVQTSFKPVYDEYTKQSAAKKEYDTFLNQIHERLETLAGEQVSSEESNTSLDQIGTNLDSASVPVDKRDYEEAVRLLGMNDPEMARYDAEIARLVAEKEMVDPKLEDFLRRLDQQEQDVADFDELVSRLAVVRGTEPDVLDAMAKCDFESARQQIASNDAEMDLIDSDLIDAISAADTKEAELQNWNKRDSRWQTFQSNVAELSNWKAQDSEALVTTGNEIQGFVTTEDYKLASETFDTAEGQLDEAWDKHVEQKSAQPTYDTAVPGLNDRAERAGTSDALDQPLQDQLGSILTTLENMAIAAGEKDYVSATEAIKDVVDRLDALEQGIKEAEIRADLNEEMGVDPNSSDQALEDELNKRLYDDEYPPLEKRVIDARAALSGEPLGVKLDQMVDQLETDLESITGTANSSDFAGALAGVRDSVKSVNVFDEELSEQLERKTQFEELHTRLDQDIIGLMTSELTTVVADAKELHKRSSEIIKISGDGEYFNALNVLNHWDEQVQELSKRNDTMGLLKTEVVPAWNALLPRYEAAMANRNEEIASERQAVERSGAIVGNAVDVEQYQTAKDEMDNLRANLDAYEPKAELALAHEQYNETLATLELGALMMEMRSTTSPEVQEEVQACEDADTKRLDHEKAAEWSEANNAAYAQSSLIGKYTAKMVGIKAAKDTYEKSAPPLLKKIDEFFPVEEDDPTGTIKKHEKIISDIRTRLEFQATEGRWLEAVTIITELTDAFVIGEDEINRLFRASDDDINGLIKTQMNIARTNIISPASDAVLKFEMFVRAEIAGERDFQKAVRKANYMIDILGGVAACFPPLGGAFAGGLKAGKAVGNWVVKAKDEDMDAAALAALNTLLADLRKCLIAIEKKWDPNQGPWLKENENDLYEEIGRFLFNGKRNSAIKVLEDYGAPITSSQIQLQDQYYGQLRVSYDEMIRG